MTIFDTFWLFFAPLFVLNDTNQSGGVLHNIIYNLIVSVDHIYSHHTIASQDDKHKIFTIHNFYQEIEWNQEL